MMRCKSACGDIHATTAQQPELNDAHYAQVDARIKGSEGWELRATRRITHSIAGIEGVERFEVTETSLLTHSMPRAVDHTRRGRLRPSMAGGRRGNAQHGQCFGAHETKPFNARHGRGW